VNGPAQRREEEKTHRRETILRAARALFAQRGVEGTTMGDVAKRTRLSRSLLYVYFTDREHLYEAVVVEALGELRRRFVEACVEGATGLARVEAIGRAYVRFAAEQPDYAAALSTFQASPGGDATAERRALLEAADGINQLLAAEVQRGMDDGSIRRDAGTPLQVALSLWAATSGLLQTAASKGALFAGAYGLGREALLEHGLGLLSAALRSTPVPHGG
jgi:AcrR family transcriptional regulator